MEIKKITEGMTAPQVAQVIDENFNGLNTEKANKAETEKKLSELGKELKKEVDVEPKQSLSSSYITENGEIGSYEYFKVKVFDVKEGDAFRISLAGVGATIAYEYAIYSSDSLISETVIKVGEIIKSGYDKYISIPSGAKTIAIQYQVGSGIVTIKKLENRLKVIEEDINIIKTDLDDTKKDLSEGLKEVETDLKNGLEDITRNIGGFVFDNTPIAAKKTLNGKQLNDDGSLIDYNYDKICIIPITQGQVYKIKGQTIGHDIRLFAFYSSDTISKDTLVKIGPKVRTDNKVADFDLYEKAPIGATHLAICVYRFETTGFSTPLAAYEGIYSAVLKEKLTNLGNIRKEVDNLNSAVFTEVGIFVEGEYIEGQKLTYDGDISASELFGIYKYKVNPGERYHLSREKDVGSTGSYTYAIYSSEDANSNTAIEIGPEFNDPIDLTITIPEGAVLMVVGKVMTNKTAVSKLEYVSRLENQESAIPNFAVEVSEEAVSITRRYSETEDIRVTLEKCGVNKLMQIFSHSFVNNTDRIPSFSLASIVKQSGTDWIGPYVIKADNRDGAYTGFTGGWHGYNGDQTGAKTGDTIDVRILIDNRKGDVGRYYCNNVKVVVTNLIQGGNTKAEDGNGVNVLKEIVTYHFKENRIYVSVVITALEDISFSVYYGMQVTNYNQSIRYFADNIVYKGWSDGENRTDKKNLQFIICEGTDGRYVKAAMDIVGLGMREYSNPSKYAFVSGNKAYYSLIDSVHKTLSLAEGEQAYWRGYYEFIPAEFTDSCIL